MAMREAVSFPKRAGKEFAKNAIGLLVVFAPIAAILTLAAGTPLGGVLIFGAIGVPAMAALLTVLSVGVGGVGDPRPGDSRPYDYDPSSDPALRSGASYGAFGGGDGGGGGFGDAGGGGGGDGGGGGGF
jgi:hypothetical protein